MWSFKVYSAWGKLMSFWKRQIELTVNNHCWILRDDPKYRRSVYDGAKLVMALTILFLWSQGETNVVDINYGFFRMQAEIHRQLMWLNVSIPGADLGEVRRVRSNPLNCNRWRQRNCKILVRMTCWLKKTRPQNTMTWPQNVGKRISEDLNFRGCPGPPYRIPPWAVLLSNPLLWNPGSAPAFKGLHI